MKALFLLPLLVCAQLFAQSTAVSSVAKTTHTSLLSGRYNVQNIVLTATSTNDTTFKFYDTYSTNVLQVKPSYTLPVSYSTNWTTTYVNQNGVTNSITFSGTYTAYTTVDAVTIARPTLLQLVVPAGQSREKAVNITTVRGLAVYADNTGIVEIEYETN